MLSVSEIRQRTDILRKTPIFSEMSADTEQALLGISPTDFAAGEPIANAADSLAFRGLGILLSGKASIYGGCGEKRILMNRLAPGDVFGAATVFFHEREAVSTVFAETKSSVLFIERSALENIIENDFAVASAYIAFLSERIHFLNRKILGFTAKNADAALAGYLLRNADENGRMTANMSRIASSLGIGRTTLYRAADALQGMNAMVYDGKNMQILDRTLLENKSKE